MVARCNWTRKWWDDHRHEYELVTSEESDPDKGLISTVSPIGQALMGKEQGDEVKVTTEQGVRKFEIAKLYTIHDKQD